MMKLFNLLKEQHREVMDMFEEAEKNEDKEIFEELSKSLVVHMNGEEITFYPLLKEEEETQKLGYESIEEHHAVKMILQEMNKVLEDELRWWAKFKVLKEMVSYHINQEEKEVFKLSENLLKARDQELTDEFLTETGREEAET